MTTEINTTELRKLAGLVIDAVGAVAYEQAKYNYALAANPSTMLALLDRLEAAAQPAINGHDRLVAALNLARKTLGELDGISVTEDFVINVIHQIEAIDAALATYQKPTVVEVAGVAIDDVIRNTLLEVRSRIVANRCDGDTEYSLGVAAANSNMLKAINSMLNGTQSHSAAACLLPRESA